MQTLTQRLTNRKDFAEAIQAVSNQQGVSVDGVWGSSCALVAAGICTGTQQQTPVNLIVLAHDKMVDDFRDDLLLFSDRRSVHFPAVNSGNTQDSYQKDDVHGDRIRVLKNLMEFDDIPSTEPLFVVTSIQALLQPVPEKESLRQATRTLKIGQRVDIDDLQQWFVENGYHATSAIELPGEFSRHGGILDIFAPEWDQPVRVEFWDDEIESMRLFDVRTQRSIETQTQIELTSIRAFYQGQDHLASYLPSGSCTTLVELGELDRQAREHIGRAANYQQCHGVHDVFATLTKFGHLVISGLAAGTLEHDVTLAIESVERFQGNVDSISLQVEQIGNDHELVIVCPTEAEIQRMQEILAETRAADRGRIEYHVGYLKQGFHWIAEKIVVLSVGELFKRTQLRRHNIRQTGRPLDSFSELRDGELIVHLAHGIGRYRGLELLEKEGCQAEHLVIEFHGGTRVYVPAARIDLVQKYIGGRKTRPALARIGGATWKNQKQAVQNAVQDMAAELLELQANRQARPGIEFHADSNWQQEFDASFPYKETDDQLAAIEDIKEDMQSRRSMDRLLCGDVGFGKTEVAMRAVFKAIDSGYQVAVLVPTTILAEQHYHSFKARMAQFPIKVARLSRFASTAEQHEVVRELRRGSIDVVIGTHRVASKDVQFANLGLVIIDEEQRFGVEIKERLKNVVNNVDVLTLSATPIPRTLHMAMVGVRDISNLLVAPEERVSIETRVVRFKEELVRVAIQRELDRDGQVFYVHNRVHDIESVKRRLQKIVPQARIEIGHGQMPESDLEQVMVGFVNHDYDILLATTIVESGLDIPNANTIFVDDANRYGLSDLHQLRGRVGRYKHRAYCYMLVDKHKHITPDAARRLRAIEEYSEMGAGFAISMRDLEIRGAGNLLGTQQSGHIATVGYEFYCGLLEKAVRQLKKLPPKLAVDVELDLPVDAYLPHDYVTDIRARIDFYRRLSKISEFGEISELETELIDRFGRLPTSVTQLLEISQIRLEAALWQIAAIINDDGFLRIRYTDAMRIKQLARNSAIHLRIADDRTAYVTVPKTVSGGALMIEFVKSILQP
ncbi:MAG: transcription-repair coupling factor [Pirellulales bacterium]|jgi:transcription-repair coupling factor (superfamily II helicase)